jgi:hypothetical protein
MKILENAKSKKELAYGLGFGLANIFPYQDDYLKKEILEMRKQNVFFDYGFSFKQYNNF